MLRSLLLSLFVLPALACSGNVDEGQGAAGAGGGGGSGGSCAQPDISCPAKAPYPGSACAVVSTCQYPVGDGANTWTYSCDAGRWRGEATCQGPIGGGCPIPPLAEACDAPFKGSAKGSIELGGADPEKPFEPLAEGAELPLTWGGQGSPMVAYRLRVTGVDASCVRIDTTLSAAGKPGAPTPNAIVLHCGESLSVYSVFPMDSVSCEQPMNEYVDLEVAVDVQGVGAVKRKFKVANPGCALPG